MRLNLNYKKIAIGSAIGIVFAIINGYLLFPQILKFILKKNLQLRPGSQVRPLFENIPFPLIFKAHIFNITNADDVMNGAKPRVNQIGPFVFEEWKERYDIKDDPAKDTVTYTMRNRFVFRPDLSNGLTGDEIVTLPHLIIIGTVMAVRRDREPMLPIVTKALKGIFDPPTPFIKVKVMDILFNGFGFHCDGPDFTSKTVCEAIKAEGQGVKIVNETFLEISLLGHKNMTSIGRFTVFRGVKDIRNLGRIISVNGDKMQSVWDGDECNRFVGTDSTIFPPFLTSEEGLSSFTPDVCMSFNAHYVRKSSYNGMPSSIYSIDFGDFKNQPEKQCFCHDPPDDCPPKGTIDLMPCLGSPIYGSKPHFLDVDPEIAAQVEGLAPNRSIHDVFVNFEPISGTPFEGFKRLQFNLEIDAFEGIETMRKFPKAFLPLIWVEEGVQLNTTYTNILKYQLFLAKKFNTTTIWIGIVGGIIGIIFSSFMLFKQNSKKKTISSTSAASVITVDIARKNLNNIQFLSDKISPVVAERKEEN